MTRPLTALCAALALLFSPVSADEHSDARWSIAVGEFPTLHGDYVTRIAVGGTVKWTASAADHTVRMSLQGDDLQSLMISYKALQVNCMSSTETTVEKVDEVLQFSGTVDCATNPKNRREREPFPISGWFGLTK